MEQGERKLPKDRKREEYFLYRVDTPEVDQGNEVVSNVCKFKEQWNRERLKCRGLEERRLRCIYKVNSEEVNLTNEFVSNVYKSEEKWNREMGKRRRLEEGQLFYMQRK